MTGGDVVVSGGIVGISPTDLAASEKGALQIDGIFQVPKSTGAIVAGQPIYWNPTGTPDSGDASSGAANQTLNITDGERRTWLGLFTAVAEAQGKRFRLIPVHPALAKFPALFIDLFTGIFGQSLDLPAFVSYVSRDVHFGIGRARTVLGWEPAYRDLHEAVREMAAWYAKKKEAGHGRA